MICSNAGVRGPASWRAVLFRWGSGEGVDDGVSLCGSLGELPTKKYLLERKFAVRTGLPHRSHEASSVSIERLFCETL